MNARIAGGPRRWVMLALLAGWPAIASAADRSIVGWGDRVVGGSMDGDFVAVAAGYSHSLGLKADGSIVAWGDNDDGQCNVPSPNTGFVAVAGGADYSLGLKADGSIVAWGQNWYGQCNVPAPNTDFVAVAGGSCHSLGLKADGSIVAWGDNDDGQCNVPAPNTDFTAVAAGRNDSLGLKTDGSVVAWGYPGSVPAANTDFVAVARCFYHSLGLKADGSIVAWGTPGSVPSPNTGFVAVAAGRGHSLGLKADGSIVAWGDNSFGQCDVPAPNTDFTAVAAGWNHNLGVRADGSVAAWGRNSFGQCNVPAPNTNFLAVAAGFEHSLGLKADGSIVAWGYPGSVPAPNTDFVAIAAGHSYSLGLKADGSILGWGNNYYGSLNVPAPNTGFVAVAAFDWHSLGVKADGSIAAWGRNNYGQCNVPAPNMHFVAVAAGFYHSLGLKADGSVVAWGRNNSGQCNMPAPNTDFVAIAAGGWHSLGLKADSSVVAWGRNWNGQCNVPSPNTNFLAVAVGFEHSVGIITIPPRVISHSPLGNVEGPIDRVDVTFNEAVDQTTFTVEDIGIVGPGGPIMPDPPTPSTEHGDNTWQISFAPQPTYGEYHIYIGPHIEDASENEMDQDRDGIEGEEPDDMYDASFTIVSVQELTLGELFADGFAETAEARFYRITVSVGQDLEMRLDDLDDSGLNELYASFARIPTRSDFEYRGTTLSVADQALRIPGTLAGTYYILAYTSDVPEPSPSDFTISADLLPISITNVTPDQGWNADTDPPTSTIYGSGFNPDATVLLDREGQQDILATDVTWLDPATLFARLHVQGAEPGVWDVTVTNPNSTSASYPFTVLEGGLPRLEASLILPSAVRRDTSATLYIEYANTGSAPMLAPLLKLHGTLDPLLTADEALAGPGLATDNPPPGLTDTVQVLGLGSGPDPGVLNPGDSGTITVYYRGLRQPWDWPMPPIEFTLGVLTADETTPIDWTEVEAEIRPPDADPTTWDPMFAQLQVQIGSTWGDYVTILTSDAERRGAAGRQTNRVHELLAMEIDRAYGYPTGIIAGSVVHHVSDAPIDNVKVAATETADSSGFVEDITIGDGSFFLYGLASGAYNMSIDGYLVQEEGEVNLEDDLTGLEIRVVKAGELTGIVTGPDGQVIGDAWVELRNAEGHALGASTNPGGQYRIAGIAAGEWDLSVQADGYVSPDTTALAIPPEGTMVVNLSVLRGASVEGVVTDGAGQPVPDAIVLASSSAGFAQSATTDGSGHYVISGLGAGEWHMTASAPGHMAASTAPLLLSPDDIITGADFALPDGVAFEGAVMQEDGITPVPTALVVFLSGEETVGTAFASEDGVFVHDRLGPGEYSASVLAAGYAEAAVTFELTADGLGSPLVIVLSTVSEAGAAAPLWDPVLLAKELIVRDVAVGFWTAGWKNACDLLLHYLGPLGPDDTRGAVRERHFPPSHELSLEAKSITNCEFSFTKVKQEVEPKLRRALESMICNEGQVRVVSGACTPLDFYLPGRKWGAWDSTWSFGGTEAGSYKLAEWTTACGNDSCTIDGTVEYSFKDVYQFTDLGGFDSLAYALGIAGWATSFSTSLTIRDAFHYTLECPEPPDPTTDDADEGSIPVVIPVDPNDKVGTAGNGTEEFIPPGQLLVYTVYFENESVASAAVLEVHVTDQLDSDLEWTTFELGGIEFGAYHVQVPAGQTQFQTSMAIDGWTWNGEEGWHTGDTPLIMDIVADMDIATGQVTWDLVSYDPETGSPPEDPYAGFLPPDDPDDVTHRGEGHFTFQIRPKPDLPTGRQITNMANIIFDTNPAIQTPWTLNTIDNGAPNSTVTRLPAITATHPFTIEWTGQDDGGGSGIATYDVYVSVDAGPFGLWTTTTEASAVLNGQPGHGYAFYTVATDNVGNREAAPPQADARTTVAILNNPPVCDAGVPYAAECGGAVTEIALDGTGSSDPDDDPLGYLWETDCPGGSFDDRTSATATLSVDTSCACTVACNVTLTVDDGTETDTCTTTVTISDTTAPVVTCSVTTDVLWSPDHHLENVGLTTTVSDDCDPTGAANSLVIEVWSDETEIPDTGDGTGRHAPDAKDIYTGLRLRNERRATENGRVYLIVARAKDASDNIGFGYCTVVVPHDQSQEGLDEIAAQAVADLAIAESTPGTTIAEKVAPLGYHQHGISEELGPHQ